jgi:hypothetical protein
MDNPHEPWLLGTDIKVLHYDSMFGSWAFCTRNVKHCPRVTCSETADAGLHVDSGLRRDYKYPRSVW